MPPPTPLRDHFKKPFLDDCPWPSFHSNWAVKMVDRLNPVLRHRDSRAHTELHLGTQIVADVGALERERSPSLFDPHGMNGSAGHAGGGVATATRPEVYAPPAELSAEADFADTDIFEVKVYRGGGSWNLVAAVELVSPSNKESDASRRAFAVKCAAYLQKGVSVVVVDVVTEHRSRPHADLCDLLALPAGLRWSSPTGLAAVSYRPAKRADGDRERVRLDLWPRPLAVGEPLPTLPLWLAPDLAIELELGVTYAAAIDSLALD